MLHGRLLSVSDLVVVSGAAFQQLHMRSQLRTLTDTCEAERNLITLAAVKALAEAYQKEVF